MKKIGFIGLGLMGHGMAKNLLRKGHPLSFVVHRNRSNLADLLELGGKEVSSPKELIAQSDVVILCVTGTPQVEASVYGGLLEGARKGQIVVDCSTSMPESTDRIRAEFEAKGARFVDAPLARTPPSRASRSPPAPGLAFPLKASSSWSRPAAPTPTCSRCSCRRRSRAT